MTVWVTPVRSSIISRDGITLHPPIGKAGTVEEPELIGVVKGVNTVARICALAVTDPDGAAGFRTKEAAVAGEMLVSASCLSRAPASS